MLSTYYVFHGMAAALEVGRVGQLDLTRHREYMALADPYAEYRPNERRGSVEFVNYYSLDVGYSFVVELGRLLFPTLPDNYLRALALQLLADVVTVVFVFYLFSKWHLVLGVAAACLYVANIVFIHLVSFAYYYYWDVPITFLLLGVLLLASRRPERARPLLAVGGTALGLAVWIRASWWPIAFFYCVIVLASRPLRRAASLLILLFTLFATPQVVRASWARGHPSLSTRATWHVALVGLGYYSNSYGLEAKDEVIFRLIRDKYGVSFGIEDYGPHDEAAKKEFLSILRSDPRFVITTFLGRLKESLLGTTITSPRASLPFVPSPIYRAICLAGLLLMIYRGGDRRLLGVAAAGTYLIYVVLTSLFYFVGLSYDNVSQVALFVLFMGVLDFVVDRVRGASRFGQAARPAGPPSIPTLSGVRLGVDGASVGRVSVDVNALRP